MPREKKREVHEYMKVITGNKEKVTELVDAGLSRVENTWRQLFKCH